MRFTTAELAELETRIGRAADQALALELAIFEQLVAEAMARVGGRRRRRPRAGRPRRRGGAGRAGRRAATTCGRRSSDEPAFAIEGGRHPVVEAALLRAGRRGFVPNDCDLGAERRLWLLTGPNMAGKSTFLRQNALIAVLAQVGSFVPAEAATHRRRRPPVQPRRRGRRSGARPLDLHGRDGRDRRHPQPGDGAQPRHPRRDRPRHGDLRRPVHRLGDARASARRQPLPRAVRHALSRAGRAGRSGWRRSRRTRCASRNGRARSCSCTRWRRAPPTAPTASMSPSSPACRPPSWRAPRRCWRALEKGEQSGAVTRLADDLPLFAAAPARPASGIAKAAGVGGREGAAPDQSRRALAHAGARPALRAAAQTA